VQNIFLEYSAIETTVSYSDNGCFEDIPVLFKELQDCFKYAFYFEEGSIITPKDINLLVGENKNQVLAFDQEKIVPAIKSGNTDEVELLVNQFFYEIKKSGWFFGLVKLYSIELYMKIIRGCAHEKLMEYIDKVIDLQNLGSINEIQRFIMSTAKELANENHAKVIKRRSAIVDKLIKYVETNIGDEDLSLKWIAKNVLYMNEAYLSKLFSKETGEKFSQYLTRIRIEKALELMKSSDCDKVYEIAQQVGLGKNPQYFSQVFRKHTGYTPTEYKERLLSR
jgi:two-component system response regulator YesN